MINCLLNKSINKKSCGAAGGGNSDIVYLYNIDEIDGLKFLEDNRWSDTLFVEDIITSGAFYTFNGSSVLYNEQNKQDIYTHKLTMIINDISNGIEDILKDLVNSKYLVVFKPKNDLNYRMFGYQYGAQLSYNQDIIENDASFKLEFNYTSEYPLFTVDKSNFRLSNKVFTPIYRVNYDINICEYQSGHYDGYAILSYVIKTNSAGELLDRNNRLCEYSGLKQDAYKYTTQIDTGQYNVIGTYTDSAVYDGIPVKVYDTDLCPPDAQGTIHVNPDSVFKFNSLTNNQVFTVNCNTSWRVDSDSNLVIFHPAEGDQGLTGNITLIGNGGIEQILVKNLSTQERVYVRVQCCYIRVTPVQNVLAGVTSITIPVLSLGGGYSTDRGIIEAGGYLTITDLVTGVNLVHLTHLVDLNETKTVTIIVANRVTDPIWQTVSIYCEQG